MAKAQPVEVFGVWYPSRSQACIAHGHTPGKIDHRLARGMTLEEALKAKDTMTGAKRHPSYTHWNSMRTRCLSNSASNKRYKGFVTICDRWLSDFWLFVEDMGEPPFAGATIERTDNSKGYVKSNCVWATRAEQSRNTRANVILTCFGESMCQKDWALKTGIHETTIAYRLKNGWDVERALTEEPKLVGRNKKLRNRVKHEEEGES